MERHTKLAGVYIGMFYIFMVSMSVSSITLYSPQQYIRTVSNLLKKLHLKLEKKNDLKIHEICPKKSVMEQESECAGSFLDIFQNGTKHIGKAVDDVHNITQDIDDCVNKLRKSCKQLQENIKICENFTVPRKMVQFVVLFQEFSNCFGPLNICCGNVPNEEYNSYKDEDKAIPFCGSS